MVKAVNTRQHYCKSCPYFGFQTVKQRALLRKSHTCPVDARSTLRISCRKLWCMESTGWPWVDQPPGWRRGGSQLCDVNQVLLGTMCFMLKYIDLGQWNDKHKCRYRKHKSFESQVRHVLRSCQSKHHTAVLRDPDRSGHA